MTPETVANYIEPSNKARVVFALFILILIVAYTSFKVQFDDIQVPKNASLETLNELILEQKKRDKVLLIITLFQSIVFSWYLVLLATKSLKTKKYPPPGTSVVFRTKIVEGRKALVSAVVAYVIAVLVWAPVLFSVLLKINLE